MISGLRHNSFHGKHFLVPEHSLRFSTKQRVWVLNPDIRERLWPYMRPIIPYPTGRFFRGMLSQALRARLRSVSSLRDALADISQQALAIFQWSVGESSILKDIFFY